MRNIRIPDLLLSCLTELAEQRECTLVDSLPVHILLTLWEMQSMI